MFMLCSILRCVPPLSPSAGLVRRRRGCLLFVPLPIPPTYAGRTIENAGHMPLFFIGHACSCCPSCATTSNLHGVRLYAYAGLIGAAGEIAQRGDPEALAARRHHGTTCSRTLRGCHLRARGVCRCSIAAQKLTAATRSVALVVALGCIASTWRPIINMASAYLHRRCPVPGAGEFRFEHRAVLDRGIWHQPRHHRAVCWKSNSCATISRAFPSTSRCPTGSDYQTLVIDAENPEADSAAPGRAGARHAGMAANSRSIQSQVRPSEPESDARLRIPLDDILIVRLATA